MDSQINDPRTRPVTRPHARPPTARERLRAAKHHGVGGDPEHLDAEMTDPCHGQPMPGGTRLHRGRPDHGT